MKIQVLGTGCPKCKKTIEVMTEAANKLGLVSGKDYELEKVEKINDIMKFGITMTPGVAIDGKVVSSGKVPTIGEATTFITNKMAEN
ncbi:MAG: thioredoxin family protein [candidate division Zixibacteria bacterium]|jgi:small redox-active disulfide protein 2|nr:thioredoxin family protein [candidate division Zixibacteria bacterium]